MAGFSFSGSHSTPFFTGVSQTTLVPHKFDAAIGGYGYMLDRKLMAEQPLVSSVRATRTQGDGSSEPGEQSLNPEDLWRRSQQSWHLGAGQDYLDREDSNRRRFRSSKGVNPWTKGQISLLNDTAQSLSASGSNLRLMPAGSRLYAVDGTALKYTTDLTNWSTVTGTSGVSITGIASDGFNVWVTDGANVYKTDTSTGAAASWSTEDLDTLWYVKNRLFGADANDLMYASNIATPTFTSLFAHNVATFTWVGVAEAPAHIIAGGYSGDKSLIYRIAITKEGAALDQPTVCGELPDGEILYSVGAYLGFIFLGTSAGARFCTVDNNGNLTIGAVVPTSYPVRCFEGQGEFVWYGLTNYDGTSTGLGRMSLRNFSETDSLKPAYASDLMVTSTANVLDVVTFSSIRVFAVSGLGVYKEDTANLVASGTIDSGRFNFGITEQKIPLFLDVTFASSFAGSVVSYYAVDGSTSFTSAGTVTASGTTNVTHQMSENPCDQVEIRHVLSRGSTTTTGPTILRHTVRAQPVPILRRLLRLPLILADRITTNTKTWDYWDTTAELERIEDWRTTKQVLTVQIGNTSYSAVVEDFDFVAVQPTADRGGWEGTVLVQLKTV